MALTGMVRIGNITDMFMSIAKHEVQLIVQLLPYMSELTLVCSDLLWGVQEYREVHDCTADLLILYLYLAELTKILFKPAHKVFVVMHASLPSINLRHSWLMLDPVQLVWGFP